MLEGKKIFLISAIAAAVILGIGAGGYILYHNQLEEMEKAVETSVIYNGIKVNDVDLSGKTKEEAKTLLEKEQNGAILEQKVLLTKNDKTWEIPFSAVGASYDIEQAVDTAYETGREGDLKSRYSQIKDIAKNGLNIELQYHYDKNKITEEVQKIEQEFNVAPKNSQMKRENGQFIITEEQTGYNLDVAATAQKVSEIVESKESGTIEPVAVETQPKITKAQNEMATTLIGTYYTDFSANAKARNENLRVGCANIDGTIIAPGETFSMNEGLGPQTYENGYKDAGVYVNGKVEQGVGGGVCQITTTLYNAVILAELDVVERHNHSLTVAYVPLGRDAAVAGDYKDLKFKNNTEYPVYIEAYARDGKLVTNLYGHEEHSPGRTVEFEKVYLGSIPKPAEKITEDPEKPEGEREITHKGTTGSKVSTYKKVYENGALVSRELFSNSTYMATADEVTVGTKKADAVPVSTDPKTEETAKTPPAEQTPPVEEPTPEPVEELPIGAQP